MTGIGYVFLPKMLKGLYVSLFSLLRDSFHQCLGYWIFSQIFYYCIWDECVLLLKNRHLLSDNQSSLFIAVSVRKFLIEQWTFFKRWLSSMQQVFWLQMGCSTWPLTLISILFLVWLMCKDVACRKIPGRDFPLILGVFLCFYNRNRCICGGIWTWKKNKKSNPLS